MKLHVGERLSASGPANQPGGYVVTGVVSETPWFGLYRGKKIFYNFDFTGKRPRETEDNEWLDVLLRTIQYPYLDDPDYVAARRSLARAEARRVLGNRAGKLWPEPIDLLQIPNTRDPFIFPRPSNAGFEPLSLDEPIVVFAHPHGLMLNEWQEQVLPLASLLAVLAEILQFLGLVHDAGLLLNGLGPQAVQVDRIGRVHYVGTDMVLAHPPSSAAVSLPAAAYPASREQWSRLYPSDRYPRGFAAPECFDLSLLPDRRADLFAWGSLAYYLLTGERPGQIAQTQGRPWAHFQPVHAALLERSLRGVPPAHVHDWAEQLGVPGDALLSQWPANFLAAWRLLVHADARRRPMSVADFRSWIVLPPPPPVMAALALRTAEHSAKIFIDLRDCTPDLEMLIRRREGMPPVSARDGEQVREGPPAALVEDRLPPGAGPIGYAIFLRRRHRGSSSLSPATGAELVDPTPKNLLRLAESTVTSENVDEPEPALVALFFQAMDEMKTAEVLLSSALIPPRAWAIQRLRDNCTRAILQKMSRPYPAEAILWRVLRDPSALLRVEAARALLGLEAGEPAPDLLRRMVDVMGAGNLDDAIQAALSLRHIGIGEDLIRGTVEALEGDRPTTCPVCRLELAGRDRPEHLREVHGHVDVFGTLLPRAAALERLWERVFLGDIQANERLVQIIEATAAEERSPSKWASRYVDALEEQLDRRPELRATERLVPCLRQIPKVHALVADLQRSRDARVRVLGRELVVPMLADRLRGEKVTADDLRRQLDEFCPEELLEEKILLCLRLPNLGVDLAITNACLAQLQDERPVPCSECRVPVKLVDLEAHLRRRHGIFEFRGVRRSYHDMRAFLVDAVCGPSPDYAAWTMLEAIARDRHSAEADSRLVTWLSHQLKAVEREQRPQTLKALAEVIVAAGSGSRLIPLLVEPQRPAGLQSTRRCLALEIVARLEPPVIDSLVRVVKPLLGEKPVPAAARLNAVAALLRTTGKSGPPARQLLDAFIAHSGKLRSIEKLHQLEKYAGQVPEIDSLCAELEDQVRMNCPRCSTQLRRAQMVQHLWDRHRLVLEDRRVRDPWRVMEDWLEDYRLEKDAAILDRCRDLAGQLDPDHGVRRLQRLLLRHGIEDRAALGSLLGQARKERACLCPHCYTLIPVHELPAPVPLTFTGQRLEGEDYRIELSERGLVHRLEVETPEGLTHAGREPGRLLTRHGALIMVVGPLVLATFFLTEYLTASQSPLPIVMALALGVGLFLGSLLYLFWPVSLNVRARLVDWAWALVIPELDADSLSAARADFVAGLALVSPGIGSAAKRAEPLKTVREAMEKLARDDAAFVPHLAAFWRLTAADRVQEGKDPVTVLAEQIGRCFSGKMPLVFATHLLQDLSEPQQHPAAETPGWTKGQSNQLQILLCDQAFAAGLELSDLIELGQANPLLGSALKLEEPDDLAQLRLLWSLAGNRPWERCGPAATVFEMAAQPLAAAKMFARFEDLLLAADGIPVYLCGRGVLFDDTWFHEMPETIEVRSRRNHHELIVGTSHFHFADNPKALAVPLEKWFRYYFRDFLPQVASVQAWRSADIVRKQQSRNAVSCPECRKKVLTRVGEVGITTDEKVVTTWI